MLKLTIAVAAIALPDCVNPSLIGGELWVASGQHPRRQTTMFTLAAWTVTFLFGLVLALGLGDLLLSVIPKPSAAVKYSLMTAAGVALVLGGAVVYTRRDVLVRGERKRDRGGVQQPAALIGAGIAGLELITAFPYFAAIALIVGSGVSNAGKLWLLILYCVVYTLPLIVIAITIALAGKNASRFLAPVGDWLFLHWPIVVGPLTAAFGLAIFAFGVVQLL